MSIGLIGKKQGMTRMFSPEGEAFAVSVVSVSPNIITQIKSQETDGYSSIQVTTGEKKEKHIRKPVSGHFKKNGVNPGEGLWEFKVNPEALEELESDGDGVLKLLKKPNELLATILIANNFGELEWYINIQVGEELEVQKI